jgi:hypothetical protein
MKLDFKKVAADIKKEQDPVKRKALHMILATAKSLQDGVEHYDESGNKLETVVEILAAVARGEEITFKHPPGSRHHDQAARAETEGGGEV